MPVIGVEDRINKKLMGYGAANKVGHESNQERGMAGETDLTTGEGDGASDRRDDRVQFG